MTTAHSVQEALEMAMDKKSRMLKYAVGERLAVFHKGPIGSAGAGVLRFIE